MTYDILIRNAVTRTSSGKRVDVAIAGGRIARIAPDIKEGAAEVFDAAGSLVSESFVNGHLHLDKVYTLEKVGMAALSSYTSGSMGGAMTAIEQASKVKEGYDEKWIIQNVRKALDLAVKFGNTHIRAFTDVDTKAKLEGVKALIKAREEYKDRVTVQIVAFPQDGIARDPGAEGWVRKALELGADVVGGIPWIEYTEEDMQDHVDRMFALAVEFGKDVSMLLDDAGDAGLRTVEMLAKKTIKEGWEGRVTVQHARAMSLYPEPYYRKIEHLLKVARIGLVSDPQTGPLYARVKDLYAAGVSVALGQDDIADAYYPFGRNNMLEIAFLAAHLMWMTTFDDMKILYDLVTTNAAKALGIADFALAEGNPANLVVVDAASEWEAIWNHEAPKLVVKAGRNITAKRA
ncbi:MAG: cytosine deaminase [Treponema sp. GWB1_62_6]|nr:MAG: cytosine deaminase [Treponema sp. GWC1_61_84]OHE71685.1 MAG: cytosine deaminase [Treponema sp. GWB1_62_6]OHE71764.1 MAG: cytosine deaminase [Treponema sp. RIFOXYC1_FULL_61_9]HCM25782.1 cytosine deaminase [Treponema sp.]